MMMKKQNIPYISKNQKIDYNDKDLIKLFTEQGKILPRYRTRLSMQQQRKLAKAIKQARVLSILPFVTSNSNEK